MRKLLLIVFLFFLLPIRVNALEIVAPEVPDSGRELMPSNTESFADAVLEIVTDAISLLRPDLVEACRVCVGICAAVIFVSLMECFPGKGKKIVYLVGAVAIAGFLLNSTNSMILLGAETIKEMSSYGKLLLPVMTSAMAAQGGVTTSAALYTATAAFNACLTALLSNVLTPMLYVFLALAVGSSAMGEELLKKLKEGIKWVVEWCLKTLLSVFTAYISLTGVVSGTTDAAALKITKMTISTMVPVVGGILSDASESVLVSAGTVKNAAGIYGILAILAVFAGPFLRIAIHYLILKLTGAVCAIYGPKRITELIQDFSSGMGLILGMNGAVCLLHLISTVCFLRGTS